MSMTWYFHFGYHHPDSIVAFEEDPDFDCESTAVFPVVAESEAEALKLGRGYAERYLEHLFDVEGLSVRPWQAQNYANWISQDSEQIDKDESDAMAAALARDPIDFEQIRKILSD